MLLRRKLSVLLAAAMMAATMLAGAGNAFAFANPDNKGKAADASGQAQAQANCFRNIEKQFEKGVAAGGGPKEGIPAPTNCDHFFQQIGVIGNQ